jgi:curved DNA-binding protein CbpA
VDANSPLGGDDDHYAVLKVDASATDAEIRKAYKRRSLELHPDKGGSADDFKRLQDAYEILSDAKLRSLYDRGGMKLVESFRAPRRRWSEGGGCGERREPRAGRESPRERDVTDCV